MRAVMTGIAVASLAWALAIWQLGGASARVGRLLISSREPSVPLVVAAAATLLALVCPPAQRRRSDLLAAEAWLGRHSAAIAALAAAAALASGLRWGTFAVGGSDSNCYVAQAELLARGETRLPPPLQQTPPWPSPALSFVPTGFVPLPGPRFESAPICPSGLSFVMAAAIRLAGRPAVFVVVPLLGALAIWCTYLIGRRIGGPLCGAVSSILLACSPVFLYQIVQPMSDVPAAAWWTAAVAAALAAADDERRSAAARAAALSGLCMGCSLITRPNLAPLALVFLVFLALRRPRLSAGKSDAGASADEPDAAHGEPSRGNRQARRIDASRAVMLIAGLTPGVIALVVVQRLIYGSVFSSGYGPLGSLFSAAHIVPNLARYPRWLLETQSPFVALAIGAPFGWLGGRVGPTQSTARRCAANTWFILAFVVATFACYLPYVVFEEWWYLRFLLPVIPLVLVLSVSVSLRLIGRLPGVSRAPIVVVGTLLLAALNLGTAADRSVFRLQVMEHRFVEAGHYVARTLPRNAAILTVQESGSVRYYSDRPTLAWDGIDAAWLDRAIRWLEATGWHPYLLLENWEEPAFRARFERSSTIGALDWPPIAQIGSMVRIYDPADRARFMRGADVMTIRTR